MAEQKKEFDPIFDPMMDTPSTRAQMGVEKVVSQVTILFDTPKEFSGEFGTRFRYSIKFNGNPFTWFASEYVNDLIQATGVKRNGVLNVRITEEKKEGAKKAHKVWHIDREGGPAQQAQKPAPPAGDPPPDFAGMRENAKAAQSTPVNRVEGPKPSEAPPNARIGNGKVKHGWTRETIADEVRWWCDQCNKVIEEFADKNDGTGVEMSYDEVCKFHNTGLIQAMRGQPPEIKPEVAEPTIDYVGLFELVDDSLTLLGMKPDPDLIEAWPEKFKNLVRLLPEEQREHVKSVYRALPK